MRRLPSNRGRMLAVGCDLYAIFGKRGTNELRIELPRSEPVTRCFILITSMLWSPTGFKTEREILYKRYESVVKLMCSPGGDRVDLTDVWGCVPGFLSFTAVLRSHRRADCTGGSEV